jgi:tetratricopeptide (TPR) repeat protein
MRSAQDCGTPAHEAIIFLYHLGRPTDAVQAFRAAVARLPPPDKRLRFSIFHHLAVIYRDLGDPETAMQHVRRARAESDDVEAELLGRLVSLEASVARDMRRYRESEISFREVVEIYRPVSAIDAAVGAVELVQTQILRGTRRAARETLEQMIALAEPLREHEAVSAALMELIRCRADGVKMAVVKKVKATIKQERERLAKTPPIDETTVLRAAPPPHGLR